MFLTNNCYSASLFYKEFLRLTCSESKSQIRPKAKNPRLSTRQAAKYTESVGQRPAPRRKRRPRNRKDGMNVGDDDDGDDDAGLSALNIGAVDSASGDSSAWT